MTRITMLRRSFLLFLPAFAAAASLPVETTKQEGNLPIDWPTRIARLGGPAPGQSPAKFGAGSISQQDRYEYGSTFTTDGTHFFFGVDLGHRAEIRVSLWHDGRWSEDEVFLSSDTASYNDPMMSINGERLYFITDQDAGDDGFDIAYVEQGDSGWSGSDIHIADDLSTVRDEYFWSESISAKQYFARNTAARGTRPDFDLFVQGSEPGSAAVRLAAGINTRHYEGDPFVLPDDNTLVFVSNRPDGAGRGDLYVSHRAANGHWNAANALAPGVNTPGHEITPYVTPDGRWLLFSRDGDIYWVAAQLLEQNQE